MSRHANHHFKDSKMHFTNLRDFTYSVDVKKFSRDRGNMTPLHQHTTNIYKKLQQRSNQKIRNSQPASLAISFSKNISQKNMQTKRKLSSGFQAIKTNHHSVSIDHHLLKEKYNLIQELFENQQFEKVAPLARHIIPHFEYSNAQKNLYFWLATSLNRLHKYQQAIQEISECMHLYPAFEEGFLLCAELQFKKKEYKLSAESIQEALKLNPKSHQSYIQLALCYGAMKEKTKERDLLKVLVEKFPKEGIFLMMLIDCLIALREFEQCEFYKAQAQKYFDKKDSLFLYVQGIIQKQKGNTHEAYILFEQSLKFNNNRVGVNKSLLQTIKIEIQLRDFYKAHHSVHRIKFLQLQQTEEIKLYSLFIEGVMTMMKKKSQEAIDILLPISSHKKCKELKIQALIYKYLAYGYFKIGQYAQSIKYYLKLPKEEMDESSLYNKLLAEGIQLADRRHNFNQAIAKFNKAKQVYPQKVEPYIYIAMTHILRYNVAKNKDEMKKAEVLIEALKEMEQGNKLNPNSSNLLYHRTIIHLYFQDWEQGHEDINRCIEKAEENLPKYFYLRGVCYSCVKDFKKAINEFSICLSLDQNYQQAHFEKAKCNFLLGNTEKGFNSLKYFIELNPDDLSIYKWIGDLLYEGKSYKDSLKAYNELGKDEQLETLIMKSKCLFRIGSIQEVGFNLKTIEKNVLADRDKVNLDLTAFGVLNSLLKSQNSKTLSSWVSKLNKLLQQNSIGYVFQLVDCMNLLGVASFYLHKYSDAYQSFLLVLELYQSLCQKDTMVIKSQESEQQLDLRSEDIYFNIIICELARNNSKDGLRMIKEEYLNIVSDPKQKKKIEKLIVHIQKQNSEWFQWDFKTEKPVNSKLKKVDIECGKLKLKTKPVFNLYHENSENLYASEVADKMIKKLHAGYIDNMPQGPWIRRNPYGVIFTDDVVPSENSISLGDTFRESESRMSEEMESQEVRSEEQENKKTISKKEEFLKRLKFDQGVEAKLNKMINATKESS